MSKQWFSGLESLSRSTTLWNTIPKPRQKHIKGYKNADKCDLNGECNLNGELR